MLWVCFHVGRRCLALTIAQRTWVEMRYSTLERVGMFLVYQICVNAATSAYFSRLSYECAFGVGMDA